MDYKQQSNQGCLVVDLLYLFGIKPTPALERDILIDGLFRLRENYTMGCLLAFLDRYPDKSVTVYVDNSYYLHTLQQWVQHPNIHLLHQINDTKLLGNLDAPFIVYIDNNITNGWTHLPHFMMAIGQSVKYYTVFDPWEGKTTRISKDRLHHGIGLLRNHVRICPFVITVS